MLEQDAQGYETAYNIYGLKLIARQVGVDMLLYMYNGHGDVTTFLDTAGNIVASYYYDPFGNILEETGNADNNILYAGYQYDRETGLYYLNARMYDPVTARFLQEDTYTGEYNDPLSLNLYTYCHNEPLMYIDPTGHIFEGLYKKAAEFGKKIVNTVKKVASTVKKTFTKAVNTVKKTIKKAVDTVKKTVRKAISKGKEFVKKNIIEPIKNKLSPPKEEWAKGVSAEEAGVDLNNIINMDSSNIPMIMVGSIGVLLADDATGIGVFDDFLIPIVMGIGAIAMTVDYAKEVFFEQEKDKDRSKLAEYDFPDYPDPGGDPGQPYSADDQRKYQSIEGMMKQVGIKQMEA